MQINETEIFVDGHDFKFYSRPYYLRFLAALLITDEILKILYFMYANLRNSSICIFAISTEFYAKPIS